jgi:hypothetical protein
MTPRLRVIAKIWAFGFAIFFIFFFVVHGYRYTEGVGFVTKNAYYEWQFWSDEQQITFDWQEYTATDKKVQLFNIDSGCYNITYKDFTINKCLQKNSVHIDTFVTAIETIPYAESFVPTCEGVQRLPHWEYSIYGRQYAHPIQAAFIARGMSFLQVNDLLYSCTSDYGNCRPIQSVQWDFMCSEEEGIVFNKEWDLYLLKLE